MNANKIGQFIKDLRCEKNLTQKELAQKIACTDKAISRWETGKGMPEISYLVSLAEVFEISVDELLKGERVMEENINKDTNEIVKDLVPVVNNQIKRTKKQTFREVLLGTLFSLVIWIIAFLISGGHTIVDTISLFRPALMSLVYPVFIMAACIGLAIFSTKYKKENFYKASMIVLFIPFIAGALSLPIGFLNGVDGFTIILVSLALYYWPFASLVGGVSEIIEKLWNLKTYDMSNTILTMLIIWIPVIIGLITSLIIYKKNKEHLD